MFKVLKLASLVLQVFFYIFKCLKSTCFHQFSGIYECHFQAFSVAAASVMGDRKLYTLYLTQKKCVKTKRHSLFMGVVVECNPVCKHPLHKDMSAMITFPPARLLSLRSPPLLFYLPDEQLRLLLSFEDKVRQNDSWSTKPRSYRKMKRRKGGNIRGWSSRTIIHWIGKHKRNGRRRRGGGEMQG